MLELISLNNRTIKKTKTTGSTELKSSESFIGGTCLAFKYSPQNRVLQRFSLLTFVLVLTKDLCCSIHHDDGR